jgi:hypothetical protein
MPAGQIGPEEISARRNEGASWTEVDVNAATNANPPTDSDSLVAEIALRTRSTREAVRGICPYV